MKGPPPSNGGPKEPYRPLKVEGVFTDPENPVRLRVVLNKKPTPEQIGEFRAHCLNFQSYDLGGGRK